MNHPDIFAMFESDQEYVDLPAELRGKYHSAMYMAMTLHENLFVQHRNGTLSESDWNRALRVIDWFTTSKAFRGWMRSPEAIFSDEFTDLLNSRVGSSDDA
jgi:hypothetical protein